MQVEHFLGMPRNPWRGGGWDDAYMLGLMGGYMGGGGGGGYGNPIYGNVPGGNQGFLAYCQPVVGIVDDVLPGAGNTRVVKFKFMSPAGPVIRDFVASPNHSCYNAQKLQLWVVNLSTKDLSICPSPEPQLSKARCSGVYDQPVCVFDPAFAPPISTQGPVQPPVCPPQPPAVSCLPWAGLVMDIKAQGNGTKYVTFAFNMNGLRADAGTKAPAGTPLWNAALGQVWTVHVNAADATICQTPVPTLLRDRCTSVAELPVCAYWGGGDGGADKCYPWNGLVLNTPVQQPNGTRAVNLAFKINGKRADSTYMAKPGTAIFNAQKWQVWAVHVNPKTMEVCDTPLPTMTRNRCNSLKDLPPCEYDTELPPPTAEGDKCNPWRALVMSNDAQTDGSRLLRLALVMNGKPVNTTFVAKPGTPAFDAAPYSVWTVHVKAGDNSVCLVPAPSKIKDRCASATEFPVCGRDPRFDCVPWNAVVLSNEAQPDGARLLTFVFNIAGQRLERTFKAKVGTPAHDAKVASVWRVHLDSKDRTVCENPAPAFFKAKCNSFTEIPPCTFAPTPEPTTPPPKCSVENREAIPGVIIGKEMPTSTGGCKLTFVYVKNAKTREVGQAEFEVSKEPHVRCTEFNVGQAWTVLRDRVTGDFCGMQLPHSRISDDYCVKPFTPINAEVCGLACAKTQCEPPGCGDAKEITTGVVLANDPADRNFGYIPPNTSTRRRITFAYARPDGSIARGFIVTSRNNEQSIAAGQAYNVLRDSKTGNFCGVQRPLRMLNNNLCNPEARRIPGTERLCSYACQFLKNCPTRPPRPTRGPRPTDEPTDEPTGTPGPGPGGFGNVDVNLRINNLNDSRNDNRGGGVFGGLVLGPHLYPPGGVWTGADFIPPEKHVFGVPVAENRYVMGTYPFPSPAGDNLIGDTTKPWIGNMPETVGPTATNIPVTDTPAATPAATLAAMPVATPVATTLPTLPPLPPLPPTPMWDVVEEDETKAPQAGMFGGCNRWKWLIASTASVIVLLVLVYVYLNRRGLRR